MTKLVKRCALTELLNNDYVQVNQGRLWYCWYEYRTYYGLENRNVSRNDKVNLAQDTTEFRSAFFFSSTNIHTNTTLSFYLTHTTDTHTHTHTHTHIKIESWRRKHSWYTKIKTDIYTYTTTYTHTKHVFEKIVLNRCEDWSHYITMAVRLFYVRVSTEYYVLRCTLVLLNWMVPVKFLTLIFFNTDDKRI